MIAPSYAEPGSNTLKASQVFSGEGKTTWAKLDNGQFTAWGSNYTGTFGNGYDGVYSIAPVYVPLDFKQIVDGFNHAVGLKEDGTVWTWGMDSIKNSVSKTPKQLPGVDNVISVSASQENTFALKKDGTVWQWGKDSENMPAPVSGIQNAKVIDSGSFHSLALTADGEVYEWSADKSVTKVNLNHIKSINAFHSANVAVKDDGTVWFWASDQPDKPAQVNSLHHISEVALSEFGYLALDSDNRVWLWKPGDNHTTNVVLDGTAKHIGEARITSMPSLAMGGYSLGEIMRTVSLESAA